MAELLNHIVKRNGKYLLISKKGRVLGTHPTREAAEKQERVIEMMKHQKSQAEALTVLLAGVVAGQRLLAEQVRTPKGKFGPRINGTPHWVTPPEKDDKNG